MGAAYSTRGEMRNVYRNLVGKAKDTGRLDDLGVDGRVILKWFLR
jgi:hypothetical protein